MHKMRNSSQRFHFQTRVLNLKLKREFGTAQLRRTHQRTVVLRIEDRQLHSIGFGECIEHPTYLTECESLIEEIQQIEAWLNRCDESAEIPQICMNLKENLEFFSSYARSAVDQALWDLYARSRDQTTAACLASQVRLADMSTRKSSITIGLSTPSMMVAELENYFNWPILKIKLGGEEDTEILRLIRAKAPRKTIRIDANEGWDPEHFAEVLRVCEQSRVELIEQPFHRQESKTTRLLRHATTLSIIADESCCQPLDVEKCAGVFDGINIKLYKCGGLLPAAWMIEKARQLNMKVMLGCMVESIIGVSAMAQLSGYADFIDLDGACLISNNPTSGMVLEDGIVLASNHKGNGFDHSPLEILFRNSMDD
ncbi:MAG: dipeptide epimerase [Verrucomicrobia bacterium]|nr:dipeptide epimerase [Verrucomicrobiota bacterium]